jgi:hypothetical protein
MLNRLGHAIIIAVLQAELRKAYPANPDGTTPQEDITQKLAKQFVVLANQSVGILTNNNPDDKGEFKALVEEQKKTTAKLGLEAVRELAEKDIKDPTVKLVILTLVDNLALALEQGSFSENTLHSMANQLVSLGETSNEVPKV